MGNRYEVLKQIIDLWEEYEENTDQIQLKDFAEWLQMQMKERPEFTEKTTFPRFRNSPSLQSQTLRNFDEPTRFLEYISRISRFNEFYTRKFLDGLPINNRLEFLFLQTVNITGKSKKTDLINYLLVEYTTGMDTIKRLINNGLLQETLNENDKRVKLLEITEEGKEKLAIAEKRIKDERIMFLACTSMNKWKKTMPVLEEICDFHNVIYNNHNDKPYPELLNLMDSLKHLHQ